MVLYKNFLVIIIILLGIIFLPVDVFSQVGGTQDNPVLALHTTIPPIIDGIANDACWQNARWQTIGQVWIPYNGSVTASDYSGRYKVIWSSTTNLLYFLMEVTDDVFVDGFVPPGTGGAIYDYDISEVFIDENKSGGNHIYDSGTTNAENAFAYHMYAAYPVEGQVTTTPYIDDMAGPQSNSIRPVYTSHFPEFALRKSGNTATREFSLIVYNDTYSETNKEAARSKLQIGKEMGLSVAYCDNDGLTEKPKVRDNMYGSVQEPSPGNLHWQNADYFGKVKLVSEDATAIEKNILNETPVQFSLEQNYPNPFNPETTIIYKLLEAGHITLKVFDTLGKEVTTLVDEFKQQGEYHSQFSTRNSTNGSLRDQFPSGIYFYQLRAGSFVSTKKMQLLK